jgi:hypothetical protein
MTDPLGLLPDDEQDPLGLIKPARQVNKPVVRPESEVADDILNKGKWDFLKQSPISHILSKDNKWDEATKGILQTAPLEIASGVLGFVTMLDDMASGIPRDKRVLSMSKYTKEAGDYFRDWSDRIAPRLGAGSPEYYYYSALSSVLNNLPSLALGFATGSQALALFSMGSQVAGNKYLDRLDKGDSQDKAAIVGGLYGVAEAIGEKIPLGFLMKNKGMRAILLSTITEIPGEIGTEIMQAGIDVGIVGEQSSWSDFAKRIKDVAITTTISAPLTAMAGRGIGRGLEARSAKKGQIIPITKIEAAEETANEQENVPITFEKKNGKTIAKAGEVVVGSYDGKTLNISEKYEGNRLEIASGLFVENEAPSTLPVDESLKGVVGKTIDDDVNVKQNKGYMAETADVMTSTQTYEDFISQVEGRPIGAENEWLKESSVSVKAETTPPKNVKQSKTIKQAIREATGQVRVDTLVPEMAALEAAMKKAEQSSRIAYKTGDKAGAIRERTRLYMMEEIRQNKLAVQREARNGFRWLEALGKKLDKKIIDVDYKDAIRSVIDYNGDALEAFIARMEVEGDQLYIDPEAVDLLKQSNRDNLSLDELRNQIVLAKTLAFQGRAKRMIGNFNERVSIVEAVEGMIGEIKETFELDLDKSLPLTPSGRKKGRWETIKDTIDGLHNILVKAEYIFDKAAGYRKDSVIRKHTFERIAQAENKATSRGIEIGKELRSAFELIKDDIKSIMTDQVLEVGGRQLTKEEAMMVALNAGNEGNRDRLKKGYQWTDKQIDAIVDSLSPNEKAFVNTIFNVVNKQGQELSEVTKQLTGERMKFVAGQYFPIITDRELSERAASQAEEKDLFQQIFHQATVSRGFTKTRVGGTDAPLLSFDVIPKHLRDTNQFISHAVPVRDVNRVINNPDFKAAMIGSVGNNAYNQLKPWLKAIANPYHEALATWDRIAGKLRSNAAITILGWSLSTAILQPSAYFQTINRIGFGTAYRGFVDFYKNYGENKELMYSLSPALLMRTQTFDADLKSLMDADTSSMWKTNHMKESFYAIMSWTDKMVTLPTWWAAYNEEMKNTENQEKAVAYADKIVRNTQSSGQMKDLAEVQRGNNTRKLFVMFYSYFSSTYNEMSKSVEMVKTGQAGFSELMKASWWLLLLPSLLSTLLRKREEVVPWDFVKGTIGYGAAAIPIIGSVTNSLLENYEFRPTPVASLPTELMRFFHSKDTTKMLKHGAMATGYLFGLPSRQVVLTGQFLMDAYEGEIEPQNLIYAKQKGGHK